MKFLSECLSNQNDLENIKKSLLTDKTFMEDLSSAEKFELLCKIEESLNSIDSTISDVLFESTGSEAYQLLQEANIRRLDLKTQRNLRKIFIAIQLAKKANDPLYFKYARGVMLRKQNKELILHKYGNMAYQIALQQEHNKK